MKHTQGKMKQGGHADASMSYISIDSKVVLMFSNSLHLGDERLGSDEVTEILANVERVIALWNAANGMPTEEAVKYIEHGREMVKILKAAKAITDEKDRTGTLCKLTTVLVDTDSILTKLEANQPLDIQKRR